MAEYTEPMSIGDPHRTILDPPDGTCLSDAIRDLKNRDGEHWVAALNRIHREDMEKFAALLKGTGAEIVTALKENTTITREAWHAIVTGQQAAPPLNEGDFQEIDLCANDAEDEFIEPHIRLKKLLPVAQERHLANKEPVAIIMGGAIYHIGLKVEDILGIVAMCR